MKKILIPVLFLLLVTSCKEKKEEEIKPEKQPVYVESLDDYLRHLGSIFFPSEEILPVQIGKTITQNDGATTCTSKKYRAGRAQSVGLVMDPNLKMFIGDVIDGNILYTKTEKNYRSVALPRSGGNITLVIEDDSKLMDSVRVDETTESKVHTAVDSLLKKMLGSSSVKAEIGFEVLDVYSSGQLDSYFANHLGYASLNTFDFNRKNKSRVLVKLYKRYYTTKYDYPDNPSGFFQAGVTKADMKNFLLEGNISPLYVSGVTYGELMFLSFEMDMSQKDLSGLILGHMLYYAENGVVGDNFNSVFKDPDGYNNILIISDNKTSSNDTYYTKSRYGTEEISKYLNMPSDFSVGKPVAPIQYTLRYVGSNREYEPVKLTEYIVTECK